MNSIKPWDQDHKLKCLNVETDSGWTFAPLFAALGCDSVWTHCPPVWLSSSSSNQTNIVKSSQKRERCVFGEISDMTTVIHPSAVTQAFQSLPCFSKFLQLLLLPSHVPKHQPPPNTHLPTHANTHLHFVQTQYSEAPEDRCICWSKLILWRETLKLMWSCHYQICLPGGLFSFCVFLFV